VTLDVPVVGHEDRRRVQVPEQVGEVLEQTARGRAVELGGRLVCEQEARPVGQRHRQRQALRVLARQRRRSPACHGAQAEPLHQLPDPLPRRAPAGQQGDLHVL
jgi:hypothetical protein